MALSFAHGAIQWLAADAVNTTYVISGLSFQPKALRFYWVGIQNAADSSSTTLNSRRGVGFAVDTANRRSVGSFSEGNGAATANCGTVARNDSIACLTDGAGASSGQLDLSAIAAGGFTAIVDVQAAANITVFWEAWGGTDITVAVVGDIAEPAATGLQSYTATGFTNAATDQVVMFAGVQSVAAVNTAEANDSGFCVGFASSGEPIKQIVVSGNSDDGSANADTDGYGVGGQCLAQIVIAGGTTCSQANLDSFVTDAFTLNWTTVQTTNRRNIFMALKGGGWRVGKVGINMVAGITSVVSGLPFTPVGVSLITKTAAENTLGTTTASDRIGMGTGTSTSSRRAMSMRDVDGGATMTTVTAIDYDQVLTACSATVVEVALDIDAMNNDGFRLIVDIGNADSSDFVGYLTFGDAPPAGFNSPSQMGRVKDQPMIRGPF